MRRVTRPLGFVMFALLFLAPLAERSFASTPITITEPPELQVHSGTARTQATCLLEPTPVGVSAIGWAPPDYWTSIAWRIPLGSCTACPASSALELTSVSFRLTWFETCSAQAVVSIVGAKSDPFGGCLKPDTSAILCGPVTQTISGTANTTVDHTVSLPAGCCISQDAFVLVRFIGFGACIGSSPSAPMLAAAQGLCSNCTEYVTSAIAYPTLTDWCSLSPANSPLWVQVAANCCVPTPTRRESWGRIKTIYR